jgi:hypothetical protein
MVNQAIKYCTSCHTIDAFKTEKINTDMMTPVIKFGGVGCNANSSETLAKKQMPELHSQLGELCTF